MTDTNKVDVEPVLRPCACRFEKGVLAEPCKHHGNASAFELAAEQLMVDVLRKQYQSAVFERDTLHTQLAETQAENKRLREALENAADAIKSWGGYADDYYKKKWNLQGDIDATRAALKGDV